MIDILLKCILRYEFLNDVDAQSDFDKKIVSKKAGQVEPFCLADKVMPLGSFD